MLKCELRLLRITGRPGPSLVPAKARRGYSRGLVDLLARLEFADANILPSHFVRTGGGRDAVDLKADEAAGVEIVVEIGTGDAVDPRADVIALGGDAVVVPLVVLEGLRGLEF